MVNEHWYWPLALSFHQCWYGLPESGIEIHVEPSPESASTSHSSPKPLSVKNNSVLFFCWQREMLLLPWVDVFPQQRDIKTVWAGEPGQNWAVYITATEWPLTPASSEFINIHISDRVSITRGHPEYISYSKYTWYWSKGTVLSIWIVLEQTCLYQNVSSQLWKFALICTNVFMSL